MRQKNWIKGGKGSCKGGGLLRGTLLSVGTLTLLLAVTTALIGKGTLPLERAAMPARICYGLAATLGCFRCARRARAGKLLWAGLSGLLCFLLAAGAALSATDGSETDLVPLLAITAAAVLAGGLAGARQRPHGYE